MTDTEQYWIDQYHDAMAALRKVSSERDALQRRIDDAPSAIAKAGAWDVAPDKAFLSSMLPRNFAGKRVALVPLVDDE